MRQRERIVDPCPPGSEIDVVDLDEGLPFPAGGVFKVPAAEVAAQVDGRVQPRFALVRGSLFFLTLAAGSFVFGAGETMFPPAMFLGTLLGLVLWKPAQAVLSGQQAPLDAVRALQ